MGKNIYLIRLTDEQRRLLTYVVNDNTQSEKTKLRAKIILKSDLSVNNKLTVLEIAEELHTTHTTVQTVRTEFHKLGLEKTVFPKERKPVNMETRRINKTIRDKILQMSKEEPPVGHKRWSIRLLASEAIKRGYVEYISTMTIVSILKESEKHNS